MEEPSIFSGATTNQWGEISDSSSSSRQLPLRHPTPNGGPTASKFKGVVSQSNGHWGAQIYANHQRIWLGTFKSEMEAAMAYDSAAIKLRNGVANRNFPWTRISLCEPSFQEQFSTEIVLNMIKDGSYNSKFLDFLRARGRHGHCLASFCDSRGSNFRELFQKELTPSDVSKLNRLVIPKKYALKYFPRISDVSEQSASEQSRGTVDDIELIFFDRSMRSWNFRYCYWKSSQSFVFTRGWNRFAKEKGLKSRDRVIFSSYECSDQKLCIIDVEYEGGARAEPAGEEEASLEMKVGQPGSDDHGGELGTDGGDVAMESEGESGSGATEENVASGSCDGAKKGFRLFGVQIV